jgi:hypothetical protein
VPRLLGNRIEIVIIDFKFVAIDFGHRGRRNVLAIGAVEVAVECRLVKIAVLSLVQHRLALVYRSRCAAQVVVVVRMESALAVLRHKLDAFLVHVVVTIIALHSLLKQPAQQLFAKMTNRRSRVRVNLECVRDFHSRYRTRAAIRR